MTTYKETFQEIEEYKKMIEAFKSKFHCDLKELKNEKL